MIYSVIQQSPNTTLSGEYGLSIESYTQFILTNQGNIFVLKPTVTGNYNIPAGKDESDILFSSDKSRLKPVSNKRNHNLNKLIHTEGIKVKGDIVDRTFKVNDLLFKTYLDDNETIDININTLNKDLVLDLFNEKDQKYFLDNYKPFFDKEDKKDAFTNTTISNIAVNSMVENVTFVRTETNKKNESITSFLYDPDENMMIVFAPEVFKEKPFLLIKNSALSVIDLVNLRNMFIFGANPVMITLLINMVKGKEKFYANEKNRGKRFKPYKTFYIPKANGKKRKIEEPIDEIKNDLNSLANILSTFYEQRLTKDINKTFDYKYIGENEFGDDKYERIRGDKSFDLTNVVFAFRPHKSTVENVKVHAKSNLKSGVIKFDFHKLFEEIPYTKWKKYLKFLFSSKDYGDKKNRNSANFPSKNFSFNEYYENIWDEEFNQLFILTNSNPYYKRGLYTGSPVSPVLANLAMLQFTRYVNYVCYKHNIRFTIYADDMTFSNLSKEFNPYFNRNFIKKLIKRAINYNEYCTRNEQDRSLDYLKINEEKTMLMHSPKIRILGIRINHEGKLASDRNAYRYFRTMFFKIQHDKLGKFDFEPAEVATLLGQYNYYKTIDKTGKWNRLAKNYHNEIAKMNSWK